MFEFVDMVILYLSKQRNKAATIADITESVPMNISEKFLEMLKSSFKIFEFSLNNAGKFSKKDNKIFTSQETKILKMLPAVMNNITDIEFDDIIAFALTLLNFGVIYIKIIETIELSNRKETEKYDLYVTAEKYFTSCLHLLKDKETERKAILIAMRALDQLYDVFSKQERLGQCYPPLLNAFNIYIKYTKDGYPNPIDVAAFVLGIHNKANAKELDARIFLDNFHIKNLKRMSILHHCEPQNKHEYVTFMHGLLNDLLKEEFLHEHYNNWAVTAAELSQYFIKNNRFTEGRNYLVAASYMMEKCNLEKLVTMITETTINDNQNQIDITSSLGTLFKEYQYECAKIAKFWGQYGIQLLQASREISKNEENQSKIGNLDHKYSKEEDAKCEEKCANFLIFTNIDEEIKDKTTFYDKYTFNLNNVKILSEKILEWFDTAIAYFTIEKDIRIHGSIILYKCLIYKYLGSCEKCNDKRIKIYKQQIELLDNAVNKLSQNTAINDITNILWLEMGITYSAILEITNEKNIITSENKYNEKLLLEIKDYMYNSMNCFKSYIKMP